ncbi:MAG TPA: response regulator, partial [Aggregatilineales bacterium]|nr:response regulator [Aggregatilineales bacterium]
DMMPNPDGFEVCRRLRANPKTASIPIIMTTVTGWQERLDAILAVGANDYLIKPCLHQDVIEHVQKALAPSTGNGK